MRRELQITSHRFEALQEKMVGRIEKPEGTGSDTQRSRPLDSSRNSKAIENLLADREKLLEIIEDLKRELKTKHRRDTAGSDNNRGYSSSVRRPQKF